MKDIEQKFSRVICVTFLLYSSTLITVFMVNMSLLDILPDKEVWFGLQHIGGATMVRAGK